MAIRDHEAGAWAAGVAVPRVKLLVFGLGAGLAGAGGVLLALAGEAFDASVFDPVRGLLWFAAVLTARTLPPWAPDTALVHVLERGRVVWAGESGELRQGGH